MSIDYDAVLCVGFLVEVNAIVRGLGRDMPELHHMEPRWDPKTGERLEDELVVDEGAGIGLFLDGREVERVEGTLAQMDEDFRAFPFETVQALADRLRIGYCWNDGDDLVALGKFWDGFATPMKINHYWKKMREVQRRLRELGINEKLRVFGYLSIS